MNPFHDCISSSVPHLQSPNEHFFGQSGTVGHECQRPRLQPSQHVCTGLADLGLCGGGDITLHGGLPVQGDGAGHWVRGQGVLP